MNPLRILITNDDGINAPGSAVRRIVEGDKKAKG
jgi:broad specificity polyphosphatase/5'/3'-nucleotidase SurE